MYRGMQWQRMNAARLLHVNEHARRDRLALYGGGAHRACTAHHDQQPREALGALVVQLRCAALPSREKPMRYGV